MLWPDPAQRHRLVEIRDNLIARIAEAEREGWLGEVEGLQRQPRRRRGQARPDRPSTTSARARRPRHPEPSSAGLKPPHPHRPNIKIKFREYGYDSFFCAPGIEGAHEKGGVEGEIGRFRRRHLTPVPHVGRWPG